MNGLLYPQPQGMLMDPRAAMLTQMGLGMMQASGPSMHPVSLGQAFGQGGTQGMQAAQQVQKAQMEEAFRQAQMTKMEEQLKLEREKAMREKQPQPFTLAPGATRFDATGRMVAQAPAKPTEPRESPLATLQREFASLPENDPRRPAYVEAIKKATTSSPLVNVDNRQDTEFNKAVGKEMGEQYANLLKADMNAPATVGKYNRLGQLLSSVNTGKFKGTTTDLKAAAKSLGVDLTAMGVTDDVAPAQASRALSNQLALELRNPAGGAGMPGALSDKDREFLIQSLPTLESDPGAVGKMIEYRVELAKREQQVAKMARAYRTKNKGKFDEGFYNELAAWSEKNPLFKDAPSAPKPATAPAGVLTADEQAELEALRKKHGRR
jgi:hypothetical protein